MTQVECSAVTPLLRRILRASFTRRAWAELAYSIVSRVLAVLAYPGS